MQAARGTSLSDATDQPATDAPTSRVRHRVVFLGVAVVLYALDQLTKVVALDRLAGRADVPVVGDLLVLRLVRNPGAAFGTGERFTVALSCLAVAAVLVVLWLGLRLGSAVWALALGALLAGVGGNLTDRLVRDPGPMRGHVIDFLRLPNWPVFNVADMCIVLAAGLVMVQAFRGVRVDGTPHLPDDTDDPDDPDDTDDPDKTDDPDRAPA